MLKWVRVACPQCGNRFPFLAVGVFSRAWLKCRNCGVTCVTQICWRRAMWVWPTALLDICAVIAFGQLRLGAFHHAHPGVYGLMGGLLMAPALLLLRLAWTATPATTKRES